TWPSRTSSTPISSSTSWLRRQTRQRSATTRRAAGASCSPPQRRHELQLLAATLDGDANLLARVTRPQGERVVVDVADADVVEANDRVARLESRLRRGAILAHAPQQHAPRGLQVFGNRPEVGTVAATAANAADAHAVGLRLLVRRLR